MMEHQTCTIQTTTENISACDQLSMTHRDFAYLHFRNALTYLLTHMQISERNVISNEIHRAVSLY